MDLVQKGQFMTVGATIAAAAGVATCAVRSCWRVAIISNCCAIKCRSSRWLLWLLLPQYVM